MNRIVAASVAFNAFGSISCTLIVHHIWTCRMEFVLYRLIIIVIKYVETYTKTNTTTNRNRNRNKLTN